MNKTNFKELLKQSELNKIQFAELLGTSHNTVNAWGTNGREYPYWVKSWLLLYIDNKNCRNLKKMIKESKICN